MLLVLTHPQSKCFQNACVRIWLRREEVVFVFGANVLVTVAASHEKHAQTAQLENWETFVTMLVVRLWLLFPTTIPVALTSGLTPVLTVLAAKLGLTPPRPSMLGWVSALSVPNFGNTHFERRWQDSISLADVWWLHRCRVVGYCDDERGLDFWVFWSAYVEPDDSL